MSWVNRGRPSKEAAIPPMFRPGVLVNSSQSSNAPSTTSGGSSFALDFSATVGLPQFEPPSTNFAHSALLILCCAKTPAPDPEAV